MTIIYMATDLFKENRLLKEWEEVQLFYEGHYKIRFKVRPNDEIIHTLYKKMRLLSQELYDHQEKRRLGLQSPYRP